MDLRMKKRGEVSVSTIVILILVILAGVLILAFLASQRIFFQKTIDKEACHQSVVLRNNALLRGESILPEILPLRCKTEKIVIKNENEQIIKEEIANAMYDCWWMLGEGKLQFFSESGWRDFGIPGLGTAKANCVICSIIKFESKARNKKIDLLDYLEKEKIPMKNITYLQYFTQQEEATLPAELKTEKLDTNENYAIVFMSIKGSDLSSALKSTIGLAGVSSFATGGMARLAGVALRTSLKAAGWVGLVIAITELVGHIVTEQTSAYAASLRCETSKGCNLLLLIPLQQETISHYCQNIESIP